MDKKSNSNTDTNSNTDVTPTAQKTAKVEKKKAGNDSLVKVIIIGLMVILVAAAIINMFGGKGTASSSAMGAMVEAMPGMSDRGGNAEQANTVTVSAKTLQSETIQSTVKVTGDVSSKSEVSVYPNTAGKVTRILKEIGETVSRGDIIAFVDGSSPGTSTRESPVDSPINGTVIAMDVATGETINTGTIVATVGALDDLELTVYTAEKYANYLKPGLPAYVELSATPGKKFGATVTSVSPVVNKSNRTIETTLEFDEFDNLIKPGMFASVTLVVQEAENTLVVPRSAIKAYNDEDTVFIIDEDNIARRMPVATGLSNDSDIQIVSGLEVGTKIITAGSATEGSAVRIASEE